MSWSGLLLVWLLWTFAPVNGTRSKLFCISVAHLKRSCHLFPAVVISQNLVEIANSAKAVISLSRNWGCNSIEENRGRKDINIWSLNGDRELQSFSSLPLYVLAISIPQWCLSGRNSCILAAQQNYWKYIKHFYCTFPNLRYLLLDITFFPYQMWELNFQLDRFFPSS